MTQRVFDFESDALSVTVLIACRSCDAEIYSSRVDAAELGWCDFVWEHGEKWTWFQFSGVCPLCE